MTGFHLAQINVARLRAPKDDPMIADFVANLDRINALAESQPGFVWRLVDKEAEPGRPVDPLLVTNLSVWRDLDALAGFVYRTAHRDIMRRRREWFHAMDTYMTVWWTPVGHIPTAREGMEKLAQLERRGPSAEAFTFKSPFPAPDGQPAAPILDECA